MKLGFLTVPFAGWPLEQVARWAKDNGFEALEVACWPAGSGEARRYAGVTHIDVDSVEERADSTPTRTTARRSTSTRGR